MDEYIQVLTNLGVIGFSEICLGDVFDRCFENVPKNRKVSIGYRCYSIECVFPPKLTALAKRCIDFAVTYDDLETYKHFDHYDVYEIFQYCRDTFYRMLITHVLPNNCTKLFMYEFAPQDNFPYYPEIKENMLQILCKCNIQILEVLCTRM